MRNSVRIANEVLASPVNITVSQYRAHALLSMLETAGYDKYPEGSAALETYKEFKRRIDAAMPRHYDL